MKKKTVSKKKIRKKVIAFPVGPAKVRPSPKSTKAVRKKKKRSLPIPLNPEDAEHDLKRANALVRLRRNRARAMTPAGIKKMRDAFQNGFSLSQVAATLGITYKMLDSMRRSDDPDLAEWQAEFEMGRTECKAWWDQTGTRGMQTDLINAGLYKFKMATMFSETGAPDVGLTVNNNVSEQQQARAIDQSATESFLQALEGQVVDGEFTEIE